VIGHHFQGQKVKGQLVADVLNSQHAETGATWRINTKMVSTCRGRRHIVAAARLQLVLIRFTYFLSGAGCECRSLRRCSKAWLRHGHLLAHTSVAS